MGREDILEDKISGLMAAYKGGSMVVDTSALHYGPWETDPIRLALHNDISKQEAQWPITVMQESVALLNTFPSFLTDDVRDEAKDYTQHIYECRAKREDEATDWVVHHRTRLQQVVDAHVFNPFREKAPVAREILSEDEYEANYTDARLVEAAYRLGNVSGEPVTLVSADHDIVRYGKRFAGHDEFGEARDSLNVGFLRPYNVEDVSV